MRVLSNTVEPPLTATSPQRPLFLSLWTNNRHWLLFKPLYNGPYFCPKGGRLWRGLSVLEFDKRQVTLVPTFTSIPFGYQLILPVTN